MRSSKPIPRKPETKRGGLVLEVKVDVENLDKVKEIITKMKCCQNCHYSTIVEGDLACIENREMPFSVFYKRKDKIFPCKNWQFDFKNQNSSAF